MQVKELLIRLDGIKKCYKHTMDYEKGLIEAINSNKVQLDSNLHERCLEESRDMCNDLETTIQTIIKYVPVEDRPDQ